MNMVSRLARGQIAAFLILAVVSIVFVGGKYARLDNLLGFGQYSVFVDLPTSGGIFSNAEVTYRGVPVGRVGDLQLTADGVRVELRLDDGGPQVPASAAAVVANRSAIGEQYVDLQPTGSDGPYLAEGSVIDRKDTTVPTPVEDLVASVDAFARSVPADRLHTVATELGKAFDGQGDNLQAVVDSLNAFTREASDALPQTLDLIGDGRTVLDSQAGQASSIRSFSADLDALAAQLRSSDPDVRKLIGTGTATSDQVGALVRESGADLTEVLSNTQQVTSLAPGREPYLRSMLQLLPALPVAARAVAPGDGTIHFGIILETNNPPACTVGYESTHEILADMKRRDPDFDDTRDDFPFASDVRCLAPQGSVTGVRSAERAALADPNVAQPWDDKPKVAPDALNLNPIATQLATVMGLVPPR
ncbi:MCE family protein [Rhodococcus hoagii]|uniref:MCE family protein n=1 Tax=Rhodococcus hoagii TaxID=43767 RepID=A0AAE4ZKE8_RHOHA|nr:MlaD family protein [Prescottella equi]MBM4468048.1 MCE family protein [Prescottella equi]MBM4535416.1 MCE family protein [Prescottella equi]MBM4587690.1 MCE family protein [Prescottella equi]MBM4634055.1 MCE family protein [Prescottella equi]MBM4640547.1 MCE family protein [Prescottella equi]